jgi:hypothetical protein
MILADKLLFLMKLTDTSNKMLAAALSVDQSVISRLKNGRRAVPKNSTYVEGMANFFSTKVLTDYQRTTLAEALKQPNLKFTKQPKLLAESILSWLVDINEKTEQIQNDSGKIYTKVMKPNGSDSNNDTNVLQPDAKVFFGNAGKRSAVKAFLNHLLKQSHPCEVCVISDESPEWLIESPSFSSELNAIIKLLFQKGFTCRQIIPAFNNADAAFDHISRWTPMYMFNGLKSFYYPRVRDNVYHRTLLVAPKVAALVSTSVGDRLNSDMTFLFQNNRISNIYVNEFNDFCSKCFPLTTTYVSEKGSEDFCKCFLDFMSAHTNSIRKSTGLSVITTPRQIFERIKLIDKDSFTNRVCDILLDGQRKFMENIKCSKCTDIICLADPALVNTGKMLVSASRLLHEEPIYYTPEEYYLHLERIISLMEQNENYNVVIGKESSESVSYGVYEGYSAMIMRTKHPFTIYEVREQRYVNALYEYLMHIAYPTGSDKLNQRRNTLNQLKTYLNKIKR